MITTFYGKQFFLTKRKCIWPYKKPFSFYKKLFGISKMQLTFGQADAVTELPAFRKTPKGHHNNNTY
jgi:hypothetical protein